MNWSVKNVQTRVDRVGRYAWNPLPLWFGDMGGATRPFAVSIWDCRHKSSRMLCGRTLIPAFRTVFGCARIATCRVYGLPRRVYDVLGLRSTDRGARRWRGAGCRNPECPCLQCRRPCLRMDRHEPFAGVPLSYN